jgi:hypothetical protein
MISIAYLACIPKLWYIWLYAVTRSLYLPEKNFHIFIFHRFNRAPNLWLFYYFTFCCPRENFGYLTFGPSNIINMRDLRLRSRCSGGLWSSGMLGATNWHSEMRPRDCSETSEAKQKPRPNNISEELKARVNYFFPLAHYISTCLANTCFCFWINILNYVLSAASLNTSRNLIFVTC